LGIEVPKVSLGRKVRRNSQSSVKQRLAVWRQGKGFMVEALRKAIESYSEMQISTETSEGPAPACLGLMAIKFCPGMGDVLDDLPTINRQETNRPGQ